MSASVCRGQHPLPVRERQGETRVYSVPIHAGFSAVRGTALFISKDLWRQTSDLDSWLDSEANLRTGEEWDRRVVGASVDTARQLRLQVLPGNFGNTPQWDDRFEPSTGHALAARASAYNPPAREQIRFQAVLDHEYYAKEVRMKILKFLNRCAA